MPRTLPWLTNSASNSSPKSTPRNTKRDKPDATPRPRKRDFFRSSPTPPSSPIQRCPSEEFVLLPPLSLTHKLNPCRSLIEGLDHDDIYMMVEDEFYAVAQSFTQHLHYAEYVRRKKEAKRQNADAIRQLARPTDGVTPVSAEMKRRDTAEALAERQNRGLEEMRPNRPRVDSEEEAGVDEDDEDEDDDAFAGTSLHGLMTSPRKARSLVGMQGVKSTTRAAAGFLRAPGTTRAVEGHETVSEGEDEDDDLDGAVETPIVARGDARPKTKPRSPPRRMSTPTPNPKIQSTEKRTEPTEVKKRRLLFDDEFDQLPELGQPDHAARHPARSPSRSGSASATSIERTQRDARNNDGSNKSRLNEVPTFLL
ncbi:hypothetical protein ATEIFO6365_0002054100 [Aspergillus terreus]|uniref:Uncharacterized protein n=1 Tax=Aspergillus terreus TaxID=33178 RepID=A0A5M3YUR2_ASPTE|nr:hypothetical protein ATETN484_0004054100 [Aspergillus terreus]GFF13430.1 hypothetical protein ATEIFO6365_0002054100 [Aspergillus terreus]